MINIQNLDKDSNYLTKDEKELLKLDAEKVRSFYSLIGPARKEYAIQMAEAEAERITIVRKAQAEGILAIRRAEAEGFKLIGEALAHCPDKDLVVKLAGLIALQTWLSPLVTGRRRSFSCPTEWATYSLLSPVGRRASILVPATNLMLYMTSHRPQARHWQSVPAERTS